MDTEAASKKKIETELFGSDSRLCSVFAAMNMDRVQPHRVPRFASLRRHISTALRASLLLSFAISTHMTPLDVQHENHAGDEYERLVKARGGHAGTDVLLRSTHESVPSFRLFQGDSHPHTHHTVAAGAGPRVRIIKSNSGRHGLVGSDKTGTLTTAGVDMKALEEETSLRADYDIKTDGVIYLGIDPPEGNPPMNLIANWPINKSGGTRNRWTLGLQPKVVLLDMFGNRKLTSCLSSGVCKNISHPVTASIFNNPGCGKLLGTTTVQTVNGVATFTDLLIDKPQSLYKLRFTAGLPLSPVAVITPTLKVLKGQIYIPDDFLWNFNPRWGSSSAITICTGCANCTCDKPLSFTTPLPESIKVGEIIKSKGLPGASFRPCVGYEFPTVWVRKYTSDTNLKAGSECDGWVDVLDWPYDVVVQVNQDEACKKLSEDAENLVCQQGL